MQSVAPEAGLAIDPAFYQAKEWDADAAAAAAGPEPWAVNYTSPHPRRINRHINMGVPRAPVTVRQGKARVRL
jgi:hypothetical protein